MLEIFQNFESALGGAARFRPIILIGPGLASVIVGLFVWLGGLGFRRLLVAIAGVVSGGIFGLFVISCNIMFAMVLAGLAALIAIVFERVFITILAAGLAVVLGFAVLARSYTGKMGADTALPYPLRFASQSEEAGVQNEISARSEFLSIRQTTEIMRDCIADFNVKIKQAALQMPAHRWAAVAALGVIFIAAGFFFWRLTSALCCAALGTLLIFAGMVLLLLYKGAGPVSYISGRTSFYATVFIAMIALGTVEQLLLCRSHRERLIRKKQTNKENRGKTTEHWRTR